MTSAFTIMASRVSNCNILKPPSLVDGIRGAPETYLSDLDCTPIDPVSDDFELRPPLEKPAKLWQTTIETSSEIKNGYHLVHNAKTYVIRNVDAQEWRGSTVQTLILEEEIA